MILSDTQPDYEEEFPRVGKDLIEFLERRFPITGFKNVQSYEDMRCYQGAHEVIDLIRDLHLRQIGERDVLLSGYPGGTSTGAPTGDPDTGSA